MVLGWTLRAGFEETCGLIREVGSGLWGMGLPQIRGLGWRELDLALVGRLFSGSSGHIGGPELGVGASLDTLESGLRILNSSLLEVTETKSKSLSVANGGGVLGMNGK